MEIKDFLNYQEEQNLLRTLRPFEKRCDGKIFIDGKEYIDLSSNDYLGLSSHQRLKQAARNAGDAYGVGSAASRLLSGDSALFHALEQTVAKFKQKEAALVFNSGYQANTGIIPALCGKEDVIFADKLSHASIIDGVRLSSARFFRFHHNNPQNLRDLLVKHRKNFQRAIIITETVFSMDGDLCPLDELVALKKEFDALLMVDEAHATGVFGAKGSGLVEHYGLANDVDIILGTFSKALGSFGGYVATSDVLKEYFVNTARSFIYSTALPPPVIAVNKTSLDLVRNEPERRTTLLDNARVLREALKSAGFNVCGESQIVPVIMGDAKKALSISVHLRDHGFWASAIRPPTVPSNASRIRFSLTYHHTQEILGRLVDVLVNIM